MKKEEKENEESESAEAEREALLDGMGETYDSDYDSNVLI